MTSFDPAHFRPFKPTEEQIEGYLRNAEGNLSIARQDFPGHHVQLLSKMSELLHMPDVETIGNAMRTKRNLDLYEGGSLVSEKECADYVEFVSKIVERVAKELGL